MYCAVHFRTHSPMWVVRPISPGDGYIGSAASGGRSVSDHDYVRLRVITVSTRAAIDSMAGAEERAVIRLRAEQLLAELERDVRADGADPELLGRVVDARKSLAEST